MWEDVPIHARGGHDVSPLEILEAQFHDQNPFGVGTVVLTSNDPSLGDIQLDVLVASSPEQRARGMVGRKFHGFDAMLFCWERECITSFHMKGVEVPIVLATYDSSGRHLGSMEMHPGSATHSVERPFMWALELPAGHGIENFGAYDLGLDSKITAQAQKLTPDQVNLRVADGEPTCGTCNFYVGGACEIVAGPIGVTQVCDQYTPEDDIEAAKKKKKVSCSSA